MYLIVKKNSQLDIRRDWVKSVVSKGLLNDDYLLRLEQAHEEHVETYNTLLRELEKNALSFIEVSRGKPWPDLTGIKAVLTVGGDGTVLDASHHIVDDAVPLIGVRSSSTSVGFLCYVNGHEISTLVKELVSGEVEYISVERLGAEVHRINGEKVSTLPVLNDFLYANKNPAETTRYKIDFDGISELHKSSGIWFSTAAGSTAAIGAAGGQSFPITSKQYQFVVREPYNPPGGLYRIVKSEFNPEDNNLSVENRCDKGFLAVDGHYGIIDLSMGDRIEFHRATQLKIARKIV